MPRRQVKKEVPRWRRGKTAQPAPQVIQLQGRHAREYLRDLKARDAAAREGGERNGAAPVNDALAATGAWRRRRQFPPVAWGAGVVIFGAALRATPHPLPLGILGGIVSAVLLIGFTRHAAAFARRWADAAAFLAAAWVPSLAAAGFRSPVPAALALTWLLLAAPWWKHYAIRPAEQAAEPQEDTSSDSARWERLAARKRWSGHLGQRADIPGGRKYEILLDGAETHIGDVLGQPRAVAAAWDRAMTEAYAEPHGTGVESRGTLTLLSRGTLEKAGEWDGTGISEDGFAVIGPFADGQPARLRFWVPRDGTRHGLVAGASGAGKSVLLDMIVWLALTSPVPVVPVILDPQNGQSLPHWRGLVPYASGVGECLAFLEGIHAAMMRRSADLSEMTWTDEHGVTSRGLSFFDPAITGLPVILVIIDEAPVMLAANGYAKLAAEAIRLTGDIAKLGRKTGVSLWPVAQVPSLAELGDQVVRSMLVGGNVVCLRTGDKVSAGMLGLEADPAALPKYFPNGEPTGGLGYVVGPDNRQAPMRVTPVPGKMRRSMPPVPQLDERVPGGDADGREQRAGCRRCQDHPGLSVAGTRRR